MNKAEQELSTLSFLQDGYVIIIVSYDPAKRCSHEIPSMEEASRQHNERNKATLKMDFQKINHLSSQERILEKYLWEHIPISSAMGIKVDLATSGQIILSAPLSNNINHKKTVFGGSLHAVATLASWSWLFVNLTMLSYENVQIVISRSEIDYFFPVDSDFKAECCMPDPSEWERFIKTLQKKGKARLKLFAQIFQDRQLCVAFSGTFVAIKTSN